ncbi:MAG TPA: phosphatase PAP2 family protein [Steroidobacteraceae bacterium]|nr:phosphatase PAP2 family protein [Steroidobacteraceae bacterium]
MKKNWLTVILVAFTSIPVWSAQEPLYLLPSDADMLRLLAPPPAVDSQAQRDDLKAVLEAQREARAHNTTEHAIEDSQLSCGRVGDALGDTGVTSRVPQVFEFLTEAGLEAAGLTSPPKTFWKRARPFAFSTDVEALGDMAKGKAPATQVPGFSSAAMSGADPAHMSYPSGHSTFGTVCAILLAEMVPEKRAELFARGLDYAHSRMVLGAHFPTDLEGGRLTGTVAVDLLMHNPRFQHDFVNERASLRSALGLSTEPSN